MAKYKKITYAISRRLRNAVFALCLLIVFVFVWFDNSHTRYSRQSRSEPHKQAKASDLEKYHTRVFLVVNVVDGDTIDINIPDGQYDHTRIRLWGVDTPETKSRELGVMYFGPEASEFTKGAALGKMVGIYLNTEKETRDKYDRLLAYVRLPAGKYLNEVLLTEGFAYADLRFQHSFYHKYQRLEASARKGKKGLWGKVTREQLPEWLQRERPYTAPLKE